jgi:hypothetical protein
VATEATKQQFKAWQGDFETHAKTCLFVRDHNTSKIVPLILNAAQKICNEVADKQLWESGFVRAMLLKARRFGGSTWVQGRYYSKTSLNTNRNAFIVAHDRESTNTIFEMAKLMHQRNPLPPTTLNNNEKSLKFDDTFGRGIKSEYRIASADNTSSGRAQGVHFLHASEEAFWRDGETLLKGLMQTVPDPPAYSEVVRESTAQGYGNSFQLDCFAAYGEGQHPYYSAKLKDVAPHMPKSNVLFHFAYKTPGQDWVIIFIPWFMHERYTKEFENVQQRLDFEVKIGEKVFDSVEREWVESEASKLRRRYGLTLEQLNWREWAINNKCRGNIRTFREEYPATVEEAFLSTGTNVYPKELCDQIETGCEDPIVIGDPVVRANKTRIRRNPNGKLRVWDLPAKDNQYFLCVDSGGGQNERQKKEKTDPDPTCIDVWNHRTGAQVAQWHGHIEYDMISDIVEMIGNLYNRCLACVELMNHGYTVVAGLKRARYPMYEEKPGEPGWLTTRKSKPMMVDDLYRMSRDAQVHIKNKATVSEMRTFKEENGKYNAETGCHDERVDTAGMATQLMQRLPRYIAGGPKYIEINNLRGRNETKSTYQEVYAG